MNLTLFYFSTSILSASPLLAPQSTHFHFSSFKANKIHLTSFFQNFLCSYSKIHASISNSMFIRFLNPPFRIENEIQAQCIQYKNFNETQKFSSTDLCIYSCHFYDCKNSGEYARGGAIRFVCENSSLTIHAATFSDCTSQGCGGAIFACGEEEYSFNSDNGLMTHVNMELFNSHYCCYSGCSAQIYDTSNYDSYRYSGYGSAILVASDNMELNYSAANECPRLNSDPAYGAQFDLKTADVKSCFINATSGDSICCAAIEYRNAASGFFSYQTIVNQVGAFTTSFNSLESPVNISSCNLVNNTLRYISHVGHCSLIYVMFKDVIISNFVVLLSNIDPSITDSNIPAYFAARNNDDITVTVENCQIDLSMVMSKYFSGVVTKSVTITDDPKTHNLKQLHLGDCLGVVVPPSLFETSFFTNSRFFSQSSQFSESGHFTQSKKFSESIQFSESNQFSDTDHFTYSNFFSVSDEFKPTGSFSGSPHFSKSLMFSHSHEFSGSDHFTKSIQFSESSEFSVTENFSQSGSFSASDGFSSSLAFSESPEFSGLGKLTASRSFSGSDKFTKSGIFSLSSKFTKSGIFSRSSKFTKSSHFSESKEFTEKSHFSGSHQSNPFSKSGIFSESPDFTKSDFFSNSDEFTLTNHFSPSHQFTESEKFSQSDEFSHSNFFSDTNKFTSTEPFTFAETFTKTAIFTQSKPFSKSSEFSMSPDFSETSEFTPSIIYPWIIISNPDDQKDKGVNGRLIGGVVGGAAGAGIAASVTFYFVKRKKMNRIEISISEASTASSNEIVMQNPIYGMNIEDDPFQNDFAEHLASLDANL